MAKGKGEENVQLEKIWEALPSRTETFTQGITGSQKEGSGNIFTFSLTKRR